MSKLSNKIVTVKNVAVNPASPATSPYYVSITRYSEDGSAEISSEYNLSTLNRTFANDIELDEAGNLLVCGPYLVPNSNASANYDNYAMYLLRSLPGLYSHSVWRHCLPVYQFVRIF